MDEGYPSNRGQGCHGHGPAARAMVRGSMSLDVGRRLYYSYVGDGICRILERKRREGDPLRFVKRFCSPIVENLITNSYVRCKTMKFGGNPGPWVLVRDLGWKPIFSSYTLNALLAMHPLSLVPVCLACCLLRCSRRDTTPYFCFPWPLLAFLGRDVRSEVEEEDPVVQRCMA